MRACTQGSGVGGTSQAILAVCIKPESHAPSVSSGMFIFSNSTINHGIHEAVMASTGFNSSYVFRGGAWIIADVFVSIHIGNSRSHPVL